MALRLRVITCTPSKNSHKAGWGRVRRKRPRSASRLAGVKLPRARPKFTRVHPQASPCARWLGSANGLYRAIIIIRKHKLNSRH